MTYPYETNLEKAVRIGKVLIDINHEKEVSINTAVQTVEQMTGGKIDPEEVRKELAYRWDI